MNTFFKKIISCLVLTSLFTSGTHARGIGEDLMAFFKSSGVASNVTTLALSHAVLNEL